MTNAQDYELLEEVGSGSYGDVFLARRKKDDKSVIIKQLRYQSSNSERSNGQQLENMKNEAIVLEKLQHKNIIAYYDSFLHQSNSKSFWIVMEFAKGKDLAYHIDRQKEISTHFPEDEAIRIFLQLCMAIKYIHAKNILHRDIKPENVFLDQYGVVKLGDFGIACCLKQSLDCALTQIGTPLYFSPEICDDKPYGKKSDIWSLGCLLYEILSLDPPFKGSSLPAIINKITMQKPPSLPSMYSNDLKRLVLSMLSKAPNDRPDIDDIFQTKVVQEFMMNFISGSSTLNTIQKEVVERPSTVNKCDEARKMFFENQNAARRNRERVAKHCQETIRNRSSRNIKEHISEDVFVSEKEVYQQKDNYMTQEAYAKAAKVEFLENRRAAQLFKERLENEEKKLSQIEYCCQSADILLEEIDSDVDAGVAERSTPIQSSESTHVKSYEELLAEERNRIYLAKKALKSYKMKIDKEVIVNEAEYVNNTESNNYSSTASANTSTGPSHNYEDLLAQERSRIYAEKKKLRKNGKLKVVDTTPTKF